MKYLRPLLFVAAGAAAGALYYLFFGCRGSCPISSNLPLTMLYMGFVGFLLSRIFGNPPQKDRESR